MSLELVSQAKSFAGWHKQYTHHSATLGVDMRFAIYLPPQAGDNKKVPVLYWLSGLTCSDENFMQKAGAHRIAAELGMAIVAPDTSPRGEQVANDDGYDLGQGAGFYVNATQAPWDKHYQMYDYVVKELPQLIEATFPVSSARAISGHSMGGHGALTIGLKNQDRYVSISAFSPISNPCNCPWGRKAFSAYLGSDESTWQEYDATELLKKQTGSVPSWWIRAWRMTFWRDNYSQKSSRRQQNQQGLRWKCGCMKVMTTVTILLPALSNLIFDFMAST